MALFGGQYYLELRKIADRAIYDAGQRLTRPALFEKMWAEHSKKPAIASLDEKTRKEEESKIRSVIEMQDFRLPYIRPSRQLIEFQKLYRQAEATPEAEYLTDQFAKKASALLSQLKLIQSNKFSPGDIASGKAFFKKLRMKGYILLPEPKPRIIKIQSSPYPVSGDGLPANFVTSHFESARRKH